MSLRLPSQNKFKPVARPGVRKSVSLPKSSATTAPIPLKSFQPSATNYASTPLQVPVFETESPRNVPAAPPPPSPSPNVQLQTGDIPLPVLPSVPAPSSRPTPPALSLIEAATRSSNNLRPSPSSATRRASSISYSMQLPSVTPHPRGPSVARSRASSRAPSESTMPPTPRTAGFPPTLAAAAGPSPVAGFPPTLASAENDTSSPVDATSRLMQFDPSTQNSMLPPQDIVRRKAPRRRKAIEQKKTQEEESDTETISQVGSKRNASFLEDDDSISVASSRAGSTVRVQRQKKSKGPRLSSVSLNDVRADEMIGSPVAENTTMGDLATILLSEGRVSQRGILIDEFRRAEDARRKEAFASRLEERAKRDQIKRRKLRLVRNQERARRRIELKRDGGNEMDISPDEQDTDHEFEFEPDRLTPPPEDRTGTLVGNLIVSTEGTDKEEKKDESDVEEVPANNDFIGETDSAYHDGLIGHGMADLPPQPKELPEGEDDATAALRAAGFVVTDDPSSSRLDADGWDSDNVEEPDIEAYRQQREERFRRELARRENDDSEVFEVDDETRFVNSATHLKKKRRAQRWTKLDTELFYEVLGETGENYTLMKAYFPGRDIRSLRLKGLRENKMNPRRVTAAIMARKPIDKAYLTKAAGFNADRSWDQEEALFEKAKADVERLRKLNSEQPVKHDVGDLVEDNELGIESLQEGKEEEGRDNKNEREDDAVEDEEQYQEYDFGD
ncbi:uncharacterized protein L203_103586 [Cryptococcus depauperatus CBS 7841]|uniref:Transcription factor TFIIIB component B'' Myb domain-containing protein n=1 Tax=Cryptococcus depauperatus CBS 7841 TaxID=1295531 RepID=A0AAJ8M1E1_9TREE